MPPSQPVVMAGNTIILTRAGMAGLVIMVSIITRGGIPGLAHRSTAIASSASLFAKLITELGTLTPTNVTGCITVKAA
jgi:hypothetical protein